MPAKHICLYEERFAHLESELAEMNVRLDSKKDDLHQIQMERDEQRRLQMELIQKVTTVTVLLQESQKQKKESSKKFEDLEDKVDNLQNQLTDLIASQRSFRNTILTIFGIGTPLISLLVVIITNFF
jgi:chromosome segregation ATPase